jgi:hypothetical protein
MVVIFAAQFAYGNQNWQMAPRCAFRNREAVASVWGCAERDQRCLRCGGLITGGERAGSQGGQNKAFTNATVVRLATILIFPHPAVVS